jgi:hypothetical protein
MAVLDLRIRSRFQAVAARTSETSGPQCTVHVVHPEVAADLRLFNRCEECVQSAGPPSSPTSDTAVTAVAGSGVIDLVRALRWSALAICR